MVEGSIDIKCRVKAKNNCALKLDISEHGEKREWNCSMEDCDISGKSLRSNRQHIQRVHEAKKFECPHCVNKYLFKSDLTGHTKRIHLHIIRVKEGLLLYCGKCEFISKKIPLCEFTQKGTR